jgi:hypothetical protein
MGTPSGLVGLEMMKRLPAATGCLIEGSASSGL